MHLQGKPVCSFDPEGLIFAAGVNSEMVKLYDLRSFDKVRREDHHGWCFGSATVLQETLIKAVVFKVVHSEHEN